MIHGDEESWDRYLPYMQIEAQQLVRRNAIPGLDPSSLAQAAIVEAWKCKRSFRGNDEKVFLAWMRGILSNVTRSAVREQYRRSEVSMEQPNSSGDSTNTKDAWIIGNSANPHSELERRESQEKLRDAMLQLPPDYSRVLQLRHIDDQPFAEIALIMERSEPAVRMLWVRALRSLRQTLQPSTKDL